MKKLFIFLVLLSMTGTASAELELLYNGGFKVNTNIYGTFWDTG